jgi:hypothetical protein
MKTVLATLCVLGSIVLAPSAMAQQSPQPARTLLTVTIDDIGRPYDVLDGACVYQQFAGFSFRGDPLQNALNAAFVQMEERARAVQADALVGFDLDFANPAEGEEGRVMLCGTLVRFRSR